MVAAPLFALVWTVLAAPACLASPIYPSPVYPGPTPGAIAHHAKIAGQPCVQCHPQGLTSRSSSDRLAMGSGLLSAPPALNFDHAAHRQRGVDCAACHGALGSTWPKKAQCATCHDVERVDQCVQCHPADPSGRVRTQWPRGRLVPTSHGPNFARDHGVVEPEKCATCHAPPDCQRCHLGNLRPLQIHPADYISSHGPDARRGTPDCAGCHRPQTFCVGCHAQSGLTQSAPRRAFGFDQADRTRYHPPGFVGALGGVPGPGHHRLAARRSLDTCVSCHQETDCVRCHSAGATARIRATPHPPGFANDCRRLRDINPRGCLKCHAGGVDRLCR